MSIRRAIVRLRRLGLAGLLLWLLLPGTAGAEQVQVLIPTYPPNAQVMDQYGAELGRSNEPVSVETERYRTYIEFHLVKEGYHPDKLVLKPSQLADIAPVNLRPKSTWIRVRDLVRYHPVQVAAAGAALLVLGSLARRHGRRTSEKLERAKVLETYGQRGGEEEGSLVLKVLSGYRLVSVLGRGGMAVVYQALPEESLDEAEAVAVKVMSRELMDRAEYVERFKREVTVCKALHHPNIVQLIDWNVHDGLIYLVMELVQGETLRDRLGRGQLDRQAVVSLLDQLASAIGYAHEKGVVHRDLKPENIMITDKGLVKIMDFGLARAQDSQKLTETGTALGTPAYMAPEQIQTRPVDARSDQYAFGVMAYELLTGRLPFDADDVMQLIFMQVTEAPPPPGLGAEIDRVILRMLAKSPEDRFATVEAAWEALRAQLDQPVESGGP